MSTTTKPKKATKNSERPIGALPSGAAESDEGASTLLYERTAARLVSLIESGTLRTGERMPSVRRLSSQQGVSISTVVQAYRKLENEGWLQARPQSGYYVRRRSPAHRAPLLPEVGTSRPPSETTEVSLADLAMRFSHAINREGLVQMGLGICNPDTLPTRQLNQTLVSVARKWGNDSNTYDFAPGSPLLRAAIAHRTLEAGCTLAPDDLVLTLGCLEGLNLCLRAVTEPGDTVIVESPTYFAALQAMEVMGLRALEVPTHPRDGIVIEALEETLERETVKACLLMPCYSNPLGSRMPDANKRRLVELLREREIPLIEDDVWADTTFEAPRPKAAKAFDEDGWVMLCSSFSKTLGPGHRVGWVAPGRWRKRVEYLKLVTTAANPTLSSLAVAEFLRRGSYDHYLRRARRLFAENVQGTLEMLGRYFPQGTCASRPHGGHTLWVELPPRVDALELFEAALQQNISIAPGPLFSARRKFGNFIRLNCAYHSLDVLDGALQTLGQLVEARS